MVVEYGDAVDVSSGADEKSRSFHGSSLLSLTAAFLVSILGVAVRAQEPAPQPAQSVAQAAQNTREQAANSGKQAKVFTNDDLGPQSASPALSTNPADLSSRSGADASASVPADCSNPDEAAAIEMELQAAQEQYDQLHNELSSQPPVISNGDLDLQYFSPGNTGLNVGSPPLLESQPVAPGRVTEAALEEQIASLKKSLQIACEPPEAASLQKQLDAIDGELKRLERQFALDQDTYYSNPNYAQDTAGKAKLDAEQEQIQSLQSEKDQLSEELAAAAAPESRAS